VSNLPQSKRIPRVHLTEHWTGAPGRLLYCSSSLEEKNTW
jgi:hypothetical protein